MSGVISGSILDDTFHEDDVTRVKEQDAFVRNVLNCLHVKGDVNKAVDLLNEILMFRAKMKLNGVCGVCSNSIWINLILI